MNMSHQSPEGLVATLAGLGAAVGVGQLLASGERITARLLIGRTLCSAALGASATIPLAWLPDMPTAATYGLACGLVTLGVAGVERIAKRLLGDKNE